MDNVLERTIQVLADVVGAEPATLNENSSQSNVDNWDSVKHLDLIMSLEEEFEIEIPLEEVGKMTNVRDIMKIIEGQL